MWHRKTVGSAPIENSFHSVASQRDGCTIVLLLRSKRKSRMLRLKGTAARRKPVSRMPRLTVLLLLILVFTVVPRGYAQNIVYAATSSGAFGKLDLDSGQFTQLGKSGTHLAGLAELGANLLGVVPDGGFEQLNLANGAPIQLSDFNVAFRCLGATTEKLYAVDFNGALYALTRHGGGTLSRMGHTALGRGTLAMSANGPALYAAVDPGTGSVLYSLNTTNGAATRIGSTGVSNVTSLVFRHGNLYAAAANGTIYALDPTTGQATVHAATSVVPVGMAMPASNFTVLHSFSGFPGDGAAPEAGLTMDRGGNLYGTTSSGGSSGGGTVFKLVRHGSNWTYSILYSFQDANNYASTPIAPVTFSPNGALFGTLSSGLAGAGGGAIFMLRPPASFCRSIQCPWSETQVHIFTGSDGYTPNYGALTFDSANNIYGVTTYGGWSDEGTVYGLTPSGTLTTLYNFAMGPGRSATAGVVLDDAGNLFGTTYEGGSANEGWAYELSSAGGSWTAQTLHSFTGTPHQDGAYVFGGLLFDGSNHLYGTTSGQEGAPYLGTVYELSYSGGVWNYSLIYAFPDSYSGPYGGVILDSAGNLYGTTFSDGNGYGSVFELTPSSGGWVFTDLYDFTGGSDGDHPYGSLVLDSSGNLYGTTSCTFGCPYGIDGTVFRVTPE